MALRCGQVFGNVQGSGMLVQVLENRKSKIHNLFAGQRVLHLITVGKKPAQQSVNRDLRARGSSASKYVVVEVVLPAKYLGFLANRLRRRWAAY